MTWFGVLPLIDGAVRFAGQGLLLFVFIACVELVLLVVIGLQLRERSRASRLAIEDQQQPH